MSYPDRDLLVNGHWLLTALTEYRFVCHNSELRMELYATVDGMMVTYDHIGLPMNWELML